jgi:peptidoglycan/xylan/chitin deacetylase (PgdA/CDA1 family)
MRALLNRRSAWLSRFVLCAAALAGGAAMAHATRTLPSRARVPETTHSAEAPAPPSPSAPSERVIAFPHDPLHELAAAREGALPADPLGARTAAGLTILGSTPHRLILFTFDDGPERSTTPELLDRLDDAGVRAVFFMAGHRIKGENNRQREQQEIARDAVRRGHVVASHTVDHFALTSLGSESLRRQVEDNERIFEEVFGGRPWLFRPPFGLHSARVDTYLAGRGYTIVMWNLGTGDYQVRTAADVLETWRRVFDRREDEEGERGGIVLLHDTHQWSVEAFTLIHRDLMARNCALWATDEELFDVVDDVSLFFVPRGAADVEQPAPPAVLPPEILAVRQAHLRAATRARCAATTAR